MMTPENYPIAVVGAGAMGSGIAWVAAAAGHPIRLVDGVQPALDRSHNTIAQLAALQVSRGRLSADSAKAIAARITWSTEVLAAADAALVIEAIIEDQAAKIALFDTLESVLAAEAIIASNTSSFSIEQLAKKMRHPERLIGLHFFNPVPAMKLVEVIGSGFNDAALLDHLVALMAAWGKQPVRVRDVPGFIVNRVARPYYAEAFQAVAEDARPGDVDRLLEQAGGFRMGPLALSDMIGHDVNYAVACSVHEAYEGKTRFRPSPVQAELVKSGALGRKSGRGFYAYPSSDRAEIPVSGISGGVALAAAVSPASLLRPLMDRLGAAGVALSIDLDLDDATVRLGDWSIGQGDGRPLSERPELAALFDLQRHPATAKAIGVTAQNDDILNALAPLLEVAGITAVAVADRPGQIVLRTMAQLANAAFDALQDAVADASDIDTAMQLGANHPEGPLYWANRYGLDRLVQCLDNIARCSGDDLYLPSPGLLAKLRENAA